MIKWKSWLSDENIFWAIMVLGLVVAFGLEITFQSISYRAGYERGTLDEALFIETQINIPDSGFKLPSQGFRWFLMDKKAYPQDAEDMKELIKEWEKSTSPAPSPDHTQ